MKTLIIKVNPLNPELDKIATAAKAVKEGKLVAFPTETVYGLGANALDEEAVLRIFKAKKRPADNPIIVHIANPNDLYVLAADVPKLAEKLAQKFWPGPLTMLLSKSEEVPKAVTAGLESVAIRMPSHPVAKALITEADVPIAAPSANLAGRPSPTRASHVIEDLGGRIELLLDGGEVGYGVESTVLDLTSDLPTILRPGPITPDALRKVVGKVRVHPVAKAEAPVEVSIAKSPGVKHKHYAPKAEVVVVEGKPARVEVKVQELADLHRKLGKRVGIMAMEETAPRYSADVVEVVGTRRDPRLVAKNLFKVLRWMDSKKVQLVVAEGIDPTGIGLAVMNRLRKAAGYNIVHV